MPKTIEQKRPSEFLIIPDRPKGYKPPEQFRMGFYYLGRLLWESHMSKRQAAEYNDARRRTGQNGVWKILGRAERR